MSPKISSLPLRVCGASNTTTEETPFSGGPYEVGVELEDVSPTAGSRRARVEVDERVGQQALRSVCFLMEDCKWCRPGANDHGDDGGNLQEKETPAVRALRECLASLDRDRRAAEARRAKCLDLIERYIARGRKSI